MGNQRPPDPLDLNNIVSLPQEKQLLPILTWLSECESYLLQASPEEISHNQQNVQKYLLNILSLPSPRLGHVLRNSLARCLAHLFDRGDKKTLFDTVSILAQKTAQLRGDKEVKQKQSAIIQCLGSVLAVAGDMVGHLLPDITFSLSKLIRASNIEPGLRAIGLECLRNALLRHTSAREESVTKDLWKATKAGLADKSWIAQLKAVELVEEIVRLSPLVSPAELENVKGMILQVMDTPSPKVRSSAAQTLASVLLSVRNDQSANEMIDMTVETKKKKIDQGENENAEDAGSTTVKAMPAGATLTLGFRELLRHLSSSYCRSNNMYRRAGLINAYARFLILAGGELVTANYSTVLDHLLNDLALGEQTSDSRHRLLVKRKHIDFLLGRVVRQRLLTEPAKLSALNILIQYLQKTSEASANKNSDSKHAEPLVIALVELANMLRELGAVTPSMQTSLGEILRSLLQSSHNSVQSAAAWTLRTLILISPSQIENSLLLLKSDLEKCLTLLQESSGVQGRTAIGLSHGLGVLVQIYPFRPLYYSANVLEDVWNYSLSLLQLSGKADLRISQVQMRVAWILIGSLMSSGTHFVKMHFSKLQLLWQNALPRPSPRDSMAGRPTTEIQYMLHLKERALAALNLFLRCNERLVTMDLSRRIMIMLADTSTFVSKIPIPPVPDDVRLVSAHLQITETLHKIKAHIFNSYTTLSQYDKRNTIVPEVLMMAISIFAENDSTLAVSPSPGKGAPSIFSESLNSAEDNFSWGVSGYLRRLTIPGGNILDGIRHWSITDSISEILEDDAFDPLTGALESDTNELYRKGGVNCPIPLPLVPATTLVDAAIDHFSQSLFEQPTKIQESAVSQIAACIGDTALAKNAGRRAAVVSNIVIALSKAISTLTTRTINDVRQNERVVSPLQEVLQVCLVDQDPSVRYIAGDSIGRFCAGSPDSFVSRQIKLLTDLVISNRDPNARAGFAFALGSIMFYVGGMRAGLYLRSVLGLLLSLASDSHPSVHYWAVESLEKAISSSGLGFTPHVSSCLGAISQLMLSDIYSPEDVAQNLTNFALAVPTLASLIRCLDAIINVLGPDLVSSKKSRILINSLIHENENEVEPLVVTETVRCTLHLTLFVPDLVDEQQFVQRLETLLSSEVSQNRQLACEAIYGMIRKDANRLFALASPNFGLTLWQAVYSHGEWIADIEEIIRCWVEQTAILRLKEWINLSLRFVTHSGQLDTSLKRESKVDQAGSEPSEFIDEAAAFSSQQSQGHGAEHATTYLAWQAVSFAIKCLRRVMELNIENAGDQPAPDQLIMAVGDLIRLAFSASTSTVTDVRLEGLKLLHDLIKGLAPCVDPEFPESTLLEQYQAQIASALTPAFGTDSSPEIAAEAISICAEFISNNIVKDVENFGRLPKILCAALASVEEDTNSVFLGELAIPSSNARTLLRLAVLSAWAEIQIQSVHWDYLDALLVPEIPKLIPMWLSTLTAFAILQFEPEGSEGTERDSNQETEVRDTSKDFLLQVYNASWLKIIHALATLTEQDSEYVFAALDRRDDRLPDASVSNYRDEPVAFFFIIYGLCFHTLLRILNRDDNDARSVAPIVLDALTRFIRRSISGNAVYKSFVFAETTDLLDRLILMESFEVQTSVLTIAANLAKNHPITTNRLTELRLTNGEINFENEDNNTDGIEQLLDLVHIIILALVKNATWLSGTLNQGRQGTSIELAAQALTCLIDITELFPFPIRMDLYGGIYSVFEGILSFGEMTNTTAQKLLVPYRQFCQNLRQGAEDISLRSKVLSSMERIVELVLTRLGSTMDPEIETVEQLEWGFYFLTVSFTTMSTLISYNRESFHRFCSLVSSIFNSKISRCAVNCFRALIQSEDIQNSRNINIVLSALLASFLEAQIKNLQIRDYVTLFVDYLQSGPIREARILIRVILSSLARVESVSGTVDTEASVASSAVLTLATANPMIFKEALTRMNMTERERVEILLRVALKQKEHKTMLEPIKPSISLKSEFALAD